MSSLPVVVEHVLRFANSAFVTSLIGAGAGALAGAYAAQRLVERAAERNELLAEIRNTNAGIMLAYAIWNTAHVLKRDELKPLRDQYDAQRLQAETYARILSEPRGDFVAPQTFKIRLVTLHPPTFPVEALQTQVFQRVSVHERALFILPALAQSIASVETAMRNRNALLEKFKSNAQSAEVHEAYFGIRSAVGTRNTEYKDSLEASCSHMDAILYFCKLLVEELQAHGRRLQGGNSSARILSPDFSHATREGLDPDDAIFAKWRADFDSLA
jgi:hypothetical protein